MENIFNKAPDHGTFSWANLGNIKEGRSNLGDEVPVLLYRLIQFTLLDVLTKDVGRENANNYMRKAGYLAGTEFSHNLLDLKTDLSGFIANLQNALEKFKIGILRIESIDNEADNIILTIAEDMDCSGLPISGETVCDYEEGFIAGILKAYTGKTFTVREIDCWASGARACRFKCTVINKE